jgi:hypothetical protein
MAALAQANRVRLRRAALVRWLHGSSNADSHQKPAELILEPDPSLQSMLVLELLQRIRQFGPKQAERMLELAEISPTRTLSALTARQRAALVAVLRLRADQLSRRNRRNAERRARGSRSVWDAADYDPLTRCGAGCRTVR